ncbi:hypothetical protein [Burkholderia cenocepacia]|uniref:hypothetical protein n=1 Tax=Burkholderia cenocepacia TaxID=95486 RepID=UPI002938F3D5|nr:hypothetical protein [Burkholderia cenocepacia]
MRVQDVSVRAAGPRAMPDAGPVLGLGDPRDRQVIADALRALLHERSEALSFAMRMADACGRFRADRHHSAGAHRRAHRAGRRGGARCVFRRGALTATQVAALAR